jgi:hypothetical protein
LNFDFASKRNRAGVLILIGNQKSKRNQKNQKNQKDQKNQKNQNQNEIKTKKSKF